MEDLIRNSLVPSTLDLSVNRNAAFQIWKKEREDYILLTDLERKGNEFVCAMMRYIFSSESMHKYSWINWVIYWAQKESRKGFGNNGIVF